MADLRKPRNARRGKEKSAAARSAPRVPKRDSFGFIRAPTKAWITEDTERDREAAGGHKVFDVFQAD